MREEVVNFVCFFFFISGLGVNCAEEETTTPLYTTTTPVITTTTDTTSNANSVDDGSEDPCQDLVGREDGSSSNYDGAVLCRTHSDCEILDQLCCPTPNTPGKRVCVKPATRNHVVVTHTPLLGLVPRHCPPEERLPEPLAVRSCQNDADCWPRVCCPEAGGGPGGPGAANTTSYCRTPQPPWQRLINTNNRNSRTSRLLTPLRNMMAYMQCTPPPPPLYDLFPKECRSMLDCFPNLCCQEHDKKVCRPPRKSLLALISNLGVV